MHIKDKMKHNKLRNSGLLFEFLLRQITADIISKKDKSIAIDITKKRFNENTEIGKELFLYNLLLNKKFNKDKKARNLIAKELIWQS